MTRLRRWLRWIFSCDHEYRACWDCDTPYRGAFACRHCGDVIRPPYGAEDAS